MPTEVPNSGSWRAQKKDSVYPYTLGIQGLPSALVGLARLLAGGVGGTPVQSRKQAGAVGLGWMSDSVPNKRNVECRYTSRGRVRKDEKRG